MAHDWDEPTFQAALKRAADGIIEADNVRLSQDQLRQLIGACPKEVIVGRAGRRLTARVTNAWFRGACFSELAPFGEVIFSGSASFDGATFSGKAYFADATFRQSGEFRGATFSGDADFRVAQFKPAYFQGAIFNGHVDFIGAKFTEGSTDFSSATFSQRVTFQGAAFSEDATFGGHAKFTA